MNHWGLKCYPSAQRRVAAVQMPSATVWITIVTEIKGTNSWKKEQFSVIASSVAVSSKQTSVNLFLDLTWKTPIEAIFRKKVIQRHMKSFDRLRFLLQHFRVLDQRGLAWSQKCLSTSSSSSSNIDTSQKITVSSQSWFIWDVAFKLTSSSSSSSLL